MSEALRLRTMARKSVFNIGKWEGYSVQQVLDLKGYNSLRWYYYNCSMISFLPDILDEIGITDEWRIQKPSVDPARGEELQDKIAKRYNGIMAAISKNDPKKACAIYSRYKKNCGTSRRDKYYSAMNEDRQYFSKGAMQRRNHGHF